MSELDWIIVIGAIIAALEMKDLFRFQRFAEMMRERRHKAHTFN